MSKSRLVLTGIRQESKAKRILGIFKPNEIVIGEPFNLHLTFRNVGEEEFPGGKCYFGTEEGRGYSLFSYEMEVPAIRSKETRTVVFNNLFIKESGYAALINTTVKDVNGEEVFNQGELIYCLPNANREELYQKYSVVVALISSTVATILTIVNVLVSILT